MTFPLYENLPPCYRKLIGISHRNVAKYKTKDSQFNTETERELKIYHYLFTVIDFVSRYPLIIDETTKFLGNISVSYKDMTRKYGRLGSN